MSKNSTNTRGPASNIPSDEPTRTTQMVGSLFAEQSRSWKATIGRSGRVGLLAGADAQDDCAIFELSGEMEMVVGSDYVRGPKFTMYELGVLSRYDLGYYLAIANLSDIAAMGATPAAFLSVVRYPRDMLDGEFMEVMAGIKDACASCGVLNVGGDIGSAERLILSGSAFGFCEPGRTLRRAGASPGDALVLSGKTGLAAAALHYFAHREEKGWELSSSEENDLAQSWRRPFAQVELGTALAGIHGITSCQDTSDGLKATIEQLSTASQVGFEIDFAEVPVDPLVTRVAELSRRDPLEFIFGDSVDFRLLFTAREAALSNDNLTGLHVIGSATDRVGNNYLRRDGENLPLPGVAWRHQVVPPSL